MAEPGGGWRSRLASVRVRTTLAVVLITGVAAVLGAWALVASLGSSLTDGVVSAAESRAEGVADALDAGDSAQDVPLPEDDDRYVHVLDEAGDVVARSADAPPEPAAVPSDEPLTDVAYAAEDGEDDEDDERYVVVAEDAGVYTVVVSQEASEVSESQQALVSALYVAVPVVVLAIGLTTWFLVGRALAPVEAIRSEVDRISADRLGRRVPQPASRDEVGELARTMNAMLARLESAQARQQQLVSDASHELRSPATVIRQHAEVALTHPGTTSTADLARVTLAEGRRLEQLVEQLLWLARTDEDNTSLRTRPLDLDDLVLEEAVRERATSELTIDTSRVSGGQVDGDALMLRRLVANLLDNAVGHADGVVTVALFERNGDIVLRVDDDGPGIPPADRERVLERFVRLDEARTRDRGGAGLGLAIVHGIVQAHGGTLRVDASDSGGARFEVVLPATA